jgi:hypothetical protein
VNDGFASRDVHQKEGRYWKRTCARLVDGRRGVALAGRTLEVSNVYLMQSGGLLMVLQSLQPILGERDLFMLVHPYRDVRDSPHRGVQGLVAHQNNETLSYRTVT